ncbi:MAG: RHS repeat-associated core domain-containing protein [Bacteroidota bacterium]
MAVGLELYETPFRSYDAQIGRFHQIDPLGEITVDWSPYTFCFDNPLLFSDPWGLEGDSTIPKSLPGATVSNTPLIPRSSPNTSPNVLKPSSAPQTSNTGSNVPGASAALTLLGTQVENPVVLGVGTVVVLATTSYVILTSDNVTTAPAIPLTGYNVRDNTGTKPITVAPPLPFPLVRIAEPEGEQYTLRARADGYYPSREWGEGINGTKWLHKGDIWKIGTTINPLTRYTQSFYKNTGAGLQYLTEFTGPLDQVLFAEKMKLLNYAIQHNGQLPPGNSKLQ